MLIFLQIIQSSRCCAVLRNVKYSELCALQAGRLEGNAVDYERAKREAMVRVLVACLCCI